MTNETQDTPATSAESQESVPAPPAEPQPNAAPTTQGDQHDGSVEASTASPDEGSSTATTAEPAATEEPAVSESVETADKTVATAAPPRQRVLIGSQRQRTASATATKTSGDTEQPTDGKTAHAPAAQTTASTSDDAALAAAAAAPPKPQGKVAVPNLREELTPELQAELDQAIGSAGSIDEAMAPSAAEVQGELAPHSTVVGTVVSIRQDDVFVDVGAANQGIVPLKQFGSSPGEGTKLEVEVQKFNAAEGLYELTIPGKATAVGDWSQIAEGQIVEAMVTGTNKGGLEVQVSHLRGFIPASQCSLYHVNDLSEFVGQKLTCLVTEVKPKRRRLVLSRRSVLETEREQARKELLAEIKPGDVRNGVVRQLRDFGAFVDIGGVDGMVHVSQIGWERVSKPSDVLEQGQAVKVKVLKISPESGKISLSIRDVIENPWTSAAKKYHQGAVVKGTVSKIADFGAFVKLEPGIEGLVHISELDHKRVFRVSDVLTEGQEVESKVLSFDGDKQRIGLSLKALMARPEKPKKDHQSEEPAEEDAAPAPKKPSGKKKLKGGIGGPSGGGAFGLKW